MTDPCNPDREPVASSDTEPSASSKQSKSRVSTHLPLVLNPSLRRPWQLFQGGFFILPLLPALGAVAIGASILGVLKQQYRELGQRPLTRALALLSLLILISAGFAYKPGEAILGAANFLPFFLCPVVLGALIQTPAQLRRMAWLSVFAAFPVIVLGCGQMFAGWQSPDLLLAFVGWTLKANGYPEGRMASVFMYANILAAYLLIVFAFSLGLWIETLQSWCERAQRKRWHLLQLAILSVAVVGCAIALISTSSRNAWGIAALISLVFALHLGWHWLVLGALSAVSVVLWAAFGPTAGRSQLRQIVPAFLWKRLSGDLYAIPDPDRRITQWKFAWSMIRERPWLGWGLRNFSFLYEEHTNFWLGHAHNLWFTIAAEAGIPAILLLCGIVGWILARAILLLRIWSKALRPQWYRDRSILLTYLIAFSSLILFNCLDVSLFDFRLNTLGWILLSSLGGVTYRYRILFSGEVPNPLPVKQ